MKYKYNSRTGRMVEYTQKLTEAQKDYFKDSTLRDTDGDLVVCYHRTNNNFDAFDINRVGANGDKGYCGEGIYFTSAGGVFGSGFGKHTYECYLNIKNPLVIEDLPMFDKESLLECFASSEEYKNGELSRIEGYPFNDELGWKSDYLIDLLEYHEFQDEETRYLVSTLLSDSDFDAYKDDREIIYLLNNDTMKYLLDSEEFKEQISELGLDDYLETTGLTVYDLTSRDMHYGTWVDFASAITEWAKDNGYDGIYSEDSANKQIREIVVFYPEQIKEIDNLYPTYSENFKNNSLEYFQKHGIEPYPVVDGKVDIGDYFYHYEEELGGWGVTVKDTSKTAYESNLDEINGRPVKDLTYTFYDCKNLVEAPEMPSTVVRMYMTFAHCENLKHGVIPQEVEELNGTFLGCKNMQSMDNIPSSCVSIDAMCKYCTSLLEAPEVPNGVKSQNEAFLSCKSAKNLSEDVVYAESFPLSDLILSASNAAEMYKDNNIKNFQQTR